MSARERLLYSTRWLKRSGEWQAAVRIVGRQVPTEPDVAKVIAMLSVLIVAGCGTMAAYSGGGRPSPSEGIRFSLPAGVTPISVGEYDEGSALITRFVVEGASQSDWSTAFEVVQIQQGPQAKTASQFYDDHHKVGEANCPGGQWTPIDADESSVLYERKTGTCGLQDPQEAIYRVLCGEQKIFQLIYTKKPGISAEDRAIWIGVLRTAFIQGGPVR